MGEDAARRPIATQISAPVRHIGVPVRRLLREDIGVLAACSFVRLPYMGMNCGIMSITTGGRQYLSEHHRRRFARPAEIGRTRTERHHVV